MTWICCDPQAASGSPFSDDLSNIETVVIRGAEFHQMTLACLRTFLNSFFVLYRLLYLEKKAAAAAGSAQQPCSSSNARKEEIHKHHVAASTDVFYKLSMYYDLPPAARLNYRHTFSGLYNCISQPVYFHNPDYQRKVPPTLEEARECKDGLAALPALLQLYPEVGVVYDDEMLSTAQQHSSAAAAAAALPGGSNPLVQHAAARRQSQTQTQQQAAKPSSFLLERQQHWSWLLTPEKVYLVQWEQGKPPAAVYARVDGNIVKCFSDHYQLRAL